jgi:hypothetical protein
MLSGPIITSENIPKPSMQNYTGAAAHHSVGKSLQRNFQARVGRIAGG